MQGNRSCAGEAQGKCGGNGIDELHGDAIKAKWD